LAAGYVGVGYVVKKKASPDGVEIRSRIARAGRIARAEGRSISLLAAGKVGVRME